MKNFQSRTNLNGGDLEKNVKKGWRSKIQSRTNLNGGDLERNVKGEKGKMKSNPGPTSMAAIWNGVLKEKRELINPIQDQPQWWRAGKD